MVFQPAPRRAGRLRSAGRPVVLVVDDEPPVRTVVMRILDSEPVDVLWASSGPDALEVAERHLAPIDLLVTDLKMPVMDGRTLAQMMRARFPGLPVLFLSAYSGDLFRDGELLPMGVAYLAKPCSPTALREVVRRLLASRKGERATGKDR